MPSYKLRHSYIAKIKTNCTIIRTSHVTRALHDESKRNNNMGHGRAPRKRRVEGGGENPGGSWAGLWFTNMSTSRCLQHDNFQHFISQFSKMLAKCEYQIMIEIMLVGYYTNWNPDRNICSSHQITTESQ